MPRYITLNKTEKCVMARIRRGGKLFQVNFTLKQFGSYAKATRAAKEWILVTLPTLPAALPVKNRMTKRNTSGVVGVRLADATRRKNGYVYADWRWVAFWSGCPNSGGIGWSVKKYGDDRAFASAFLAREAETINRDEIEAAFLKLQHSRELRRVLKRKQISPP